MRQPWRHLGFVAALSLLFACATQPDPGPGPGPDPDPQPEACDPAADTCGGETICVADQCEGAFGRFYRIDGVVASFAEFDSTNTCWDGNCGAPDPFVQFTLNGEVVLTTVSSSDTFNASFGESADVLIPAGSQLKIQAFDDDGSSSAPDLGVDCVADPLSADLLRGRVLTCDFFGSTVTFNINPR